MSGAAPLISVGMPVYNGADYIESAIASVQAQTLDDFELIVCDNASSDGTVEIVRDRAAADPRIRCVVNERNLGAAANYNRAFHLARAAYFRWHNADDLIAASSHADCLAALEQNPDAVLAYGRARLIDANGDEIELYDDGLDLRDPSPSVRFRQFFERVGLTNVIYGLMRRDALARTSLMGNGRLPAADTRMMAELTLLGQFVELQPVLFHRRMHAAASSADRADTSRQTSFWNAGRAGFVAPHWRLYGGYLRRALGFPLPPAERLRVAGHVLHHMYWRRRELTVDVAGLLSPASWRLSR